ncbi:ectoine hydroxylase [Paenibacillus sp. SYP-B4298]|uniref:ectoine hydroxylase n=1 Tax=Paenibacillus sp. SYP-B4298 TaxID=2996034 RepID=UPI0022DE090E|nr:ectoine hydroxylase [Paenibacillus sp. SYP-B4298]
MPRSAYTSSHTEEVIDHYPSRQADRPQLLPRKDPVVYSQWSSAAPLAREQSQFYARNGYLFLEQFFGEEEIAAWRKELNRLQEHYQHVPSDEVIREPGGSEVRSIFAVHRNNDIFAQVASHPRLKAIVDYVLGSQTYVHQSRINYKPGFTGKEFYWHSDFETWHVEDGMPSMRALSCSIALEDNYTFNGALMVIPGSHQHFIACVGQTPEDHYKDSLRRQEYGVPDQDSLTALAKEHGIDMPVGKAGSVLLFDCNLMHGSASNISPYPRSNVFIVYNSVDNRLLTPYSGQKPRPEYIATRDQT